MGSHQFSAGRTSLLSVSRAQGARMYCTQWQVRSAVAVTAICCVLAVAISGCGSSSAPSAYAPPPLAFPVGFDAAVSYYTALQEVTNLGLHPAAYCGYKSDLDAGWVIVGDAWKPSGQRDVFAREHRLWVSETPLLAPDSDARLNALPGVQNLARSPTPQTAYCTNGNGTATTSPRVLSYPQPLPPPYASVAFAPGVEYMQALYDVSNLGLRLADPCYEQNLTRPQASGTTVSWHPMGQTASFATSQSLVVAPAPLASATTWLDQLHALPMVRAVTSPYTPSC